MSEPSDDLRLALNDEAATVRLGAWLGHRLRVGDVVLLSGDLGAGKSALARAAIRARLNDPEQDVPSPTFTLVQTYDAPDLEVWHVDLYRLGDSSEIAELGLEEALVSGACLIEWPDRLGPYRPQDALCIELRHGEREEARTAVLTGSPAWMDRLQELPA